jgi:tetratricopeptide (TPR) repeat protein
MRLRLLCGILTLLALVATARAADISPEAKRHVELGMQHYEAGEYQDAVTEFELAYRLSGRPALLFNIARAEAKLGHDENVIAFLRRYLEERPDAPDAPAVLAEIEAREQTIASVKAKRQAEAEAAEARMRAEAMAREQARRDEERLRAERERASKPPATAPAATPPDTRAATARIERRAGIGLLISGAVVGLVGVGLGVLAVQTGDDVQNHHNADFTLCCASLESRGQAAETAGVALDVIGVAAVATGVALLVVGSRASASRAWIAPTHNGVLVGGSF